MKIIKIGAIWCPGCLSMKSKWKKVTEILNDLNITELDYDIDNELIKKYNIGTKLPVVIFLSDNDNELERIIGETNSSNLIETINKYRK